MPKQVLCVLLAVVLWITAFEPIRAQNTPPLLPTCISEQINAALGAQPYTPTSDTNFLETRDGRLVIDSIPYFIRGVNYYPSLYPWRRLLTEMDLAAIEHELALLAEANLNTLRIFLWNEALFTCPGSSAVPVAEAFHRLDGFFQRATAYGFRLIVTLNDLPDLTVYPLYDNPVHVQEQTQFIVERYRSKPAILMWDLRNEGDIDYGTNSVIGAPFSREYILEWLEQTAQFVRALDSRHLLTAGWLYDNEATIPYVDIISFHHWGSAGDARDRIQRLQSLTNKPILLQEFGYSTQRVDLDTQTRTIAEVIQVIH